MTESYEEMLESAFEELPEDSQTEERFEIPEVETDISGNRTTLKNLKSIADTFGRDPGLLMKFLVDELGTAGNREGAKGVFQGKFKKGEVQERVDRFAEKYVICDECSRPDTKLIKEGGVTLLKCEACGARSSVGGS